MPADQHFTRWAPRRGDVVQVGLDCVAISGGTTTVMSDFRRALDATTISFTRTELVESADDEGIIHLSVGNGLLARLYHVPEEPALSVAAGALTSARLVIIHGLYRYHAQWAANLARASGVPYWVVPHGSLDPWALSYRTRRKQLWLRLIGHRILREAALVLLATSQEREKAARHFRQSRTAVVHWPVRPHRRDPARGAAVRRRLGIPAEARVLLSLGRLHPMKRVLETILAVNSVPDRALHLLVVGPDSEELTRADCERLAEGSEGRVHVTGPAWGEAKSAYFDAADGYISLSHRENFGYTVAEALAAGLPVILSPGNDLGRDLLGHDCGWLLDDIGDVHAALTGFMAAPAAELTSRGESGRRWAESGLDFDLFSRRLHELAASIKPAVAR
jgi:glycosyltransferase involved in cell wall biosynthesis